MDGRGPSEPSTPSQSPPLEPARHQPLPRTNSERKDLLLVIFIHGFKGTDTTFGDFPSRLEHILRETVNHTIVESIVFPAYETKGDLNHAVIRFSDWLTTLVVEKEVACGTGARSAKVALCGHSMGGLLAADSIIEFLKNRVDPQTPLWPNIIACLAFDTPYLGVHPHVFKNSATKVAEHADNVRTLAGGIFGSLAGLSAQKAVKTVGTPSTGGGAAKSGWGKWAPAAYAVGGGLFAAAAAGAAYYNKDDIGAGYGWINDQLKYVGNLWDEKGMQARLDKLIDAHVKHGVFFQVVYTSIPPTAPSFQPTRTFVVLPPKASAARKYFQPASNGLALEEIEAHTGMFSATTNDGFYEIGLDTAGYIREALSNREQVVVHTSDSKFESEELL
ncbi:hypothetical protein BDV98DRAFT_549784 [Pterulicium gracile]|uniref:DUF676 domain-containing protein n=1 Tax=Pterulicium gracile TaxID=1884261 RepID=A0A5C3QEQ4_9AGAR|nr:hypothetical protein BDV98DRAFT_549784 [Pterula gracilis]